MKRKAAGQPRHEKTEGFKTQQMACSRGRFVLAQLPIHGAEGVRLLQEKVVVVNPPAPDTNQTESHLADGE
jgi:hypothetical protein